MIPDLGELILNTTKKYQFLRVTKLVFQRFYFRQYLATTSAPAFAATNNARSSISNFG